MRRRIVFALGVVSCIALLLVIGYIIAGAGNQKIDVYAARDFEKETQIPLMTISDKKELREVVSIIKTSDKIDGKVDVAPPDFILELHGDTESIKVVYLWLREDTLKGLLMYEGKTGTAYSITEKKSTILKQMILSNKE